MRARHFTYIAFGLLMLCLLGGCRELPAYFKGGELLAKVEGEALYVHEVEREAPEGLSGDDSIDFYRRYVQRWVARRLKISEAERMFLDSEQEMERMVEEYRQSLLIRRLEQYEVDLKIDTTFTDEEIQRYYNAHFAEFKSDRTLVKGRVLRFDSDSRQAQKLQQLMGGISPESQRDLADLALKHGYELREFAEWTDYDEFLSYLPTLRSKDNSSLLNTQSVQQMRDNNSRYYFQLTSVRRSGETLPIERVSATIRRILFKERQQAILAALEEELYRKADEAGELEINENLDNSDE